jgi:hypothetical protein
MLEKTEPATARESGDSIHACPTQITLAPHESSRDENGSSFERDGYVVARQVFDRPSLDIYLTYALMLRANNSFWREKGKPGFNDCYADTLMESILLHLQPTMEQITGVSLLPTYSFLRIYETGAVLNRHTDRHSCEISSSLTIAFEASQPWPLWLESHQQSRSIILGPGDMLVYKGRELPHWRERFDGTYWIQAFFHYVNANGPLASYKFDGRPGLGLPHKPADSRP